MKSKKGFIALLLVLLILFYLYSIIFTNNFNNIYIHYLFLILVIVAVLYLIFGMDSVGGLQSQDKLFNSLVKNSDTVYIMINSKTKEVIYLSDNIEEILGMNIKDKKIDEVAFQIFNMPIVKSELNNFDGETNYVSQMLEYDNPKYNYQMWIRIKIFQYQEKNNEYTVLEISDATKEHDRQHLLISQATDIKRREIKLNEITAASYDVEMNINLNNNTYDLKYFKLDNLYFGEEKSGNYKEGLNEILKYINEEDRKLVEDNFSLENLKNHFEKFEFDSISIRYRLGNEIKNNTWMESTIFFLSNKQRKNVSILTKNVTESAENIREQNVLLQNALNDLKIADKAKNNLISTISHDIRTPLTNILGFSESLLEKKLENNIKDDIENIKESSLDVLEIIDDLLDTTDIEKKIVKQNEKEYSIFKLFNRIEENTKEYIGNKNIKLNLNLDKNLPVILMGDSKKITQAITHILNNSVKYTDEGEINIDVRGEKNNNNVKLIIEIKDTGIGMDENTLNSVIKSKDKNKGIGLVKSIVKLLDGKLEIESKLNEYTKVTITLSQKIVEDNKIREMMNNNKLAEEFDLKGKKILIVDDNKLNLKVTSRLLQPYNLDITLLESGEECLSLIKEQNNFDLILMDQMMPGLDGISTLNRLKEMESFNTPVVVLTADAMQGKREKYLESGFDDYISKPIDKSELSRVLKRFLKEHK